MENKWISVKDRLPDSGEDVLVYTVYGSFDVGFYASNCKEWCCYALIEGVKVTHWQPLLKPVN